jgi:hypothetical protein
MTVYSAIVWLNIFFAALPFIFGIHADGFHIFNACCALLMILCAPVIK